MKTSSHLTSGPKYYQNVENQDVKKREPLYTVGRNINWHSHYGKENRDFAQKKTPKNRTTIWPSNSTPGYEPEKTKNANSKRYMHPSVHSSIILILRHGSNLNVHQQSNWWRFGRCVCVCVYEGSTIQPLKKEILQFIESWIDLEGGMLNEISMLN